MAENMLPPSLSLTKRFMQSRPAVCLELLALKVDIFALGFGLLLPSPRDSSRAALQRGRDTLMHVLGFPALSPGHCSDPFREEIPFPHHFLLHNPPSCQSNFAPFLLMPHFLWPRMLCSLDRISLASQAGSLQRRKCGLGESHFGCQSKPGIFTVYPQNAAVLLSHSACK